MIGLNVSKVVYLIFAIFYCIIKYQWFTEQYQILVKKNIFYFLKSPKYIKRELINTFGAPAEANAADWLVASEFLRYVGQLAVVRAATGVLNATKDGSAVLIGSKEDYEAGAGSSEEFAARDAGSAGNNLRVVIVDKVADSKMVKAGHGLSVGDAAHHPYRQSATQSIW